MPRSYSRRVDTTPGATGYEIRLAGAADVPAIIGLYRSLSELSTRMRFSSCMPDSIVGTIAALEPEGDMQAVLAVTGGRVVGEARYEPIDEGGYEFALTIADDHQRHGIGRLLLRRLREAALERGITSLRAVVRVDNLPMLRMLRREQCAVVQPARGGEIILDVACDEAMPGWPTGTRSPRVLVEARGFGPDAWSTALQAAGFEVRRCVGPRSDGQTCALVTLGRCRLVEEADYVACLLPQDEPDCRAVAEEHASQRPGRLVARSAEEWKLVVPQLIGR